MDRQSAEAETQDESARTPSLLRRRPGFPTLMVSIAFGAVASGILNVANDLVAIYALDADATQIGLLNASESIAFLFLAIPAGILLDRVNRIKTMIWAQAIAGMAIFSVPICWALQVLSYPQLLVVSFLVGVTGMFWGMGAGSALPGIVGRDLISAAFARKETVDASAGIISPGLAGVLVALVSAPFTLLVAGAANFMAAGALLWGFRNKSNVAIQSTEPKERVSFKASFSEGLHFTLKHPMIRALTASSSITNMGLAFGAALETLYFIKVLGFTPQVIGLVISTIAVGGLVGSLVVPGMVGRLGERKVLALSVLCLPLAVALIPLAASVSQAAVFLIITSSVLYNALMVSYNATVYGLLARFTPEEMMGRQQGFRLVFTMGPVPVLGIVGGFLGDWLGLQAAMWIWVGITACAALPLVVVLNKSSRESEPAND